MSTAVGLIVAKKLVLRFWKKTKPHLFTPTTQCDRKKLLQKKLLHVVIQFILLDQLDRFGKTFDNSGSLHVGLSFLFFLILFIMWHHKMHFTTSVGFPNKMI